MAISKARFIFNNFTKFNIASKRAIVLSSVNMEKALENLQKNPYYDKYAARISEMQKKSPEEFMARVAKQQPNKEQDNMKKFASVDTSQFSSVLNPKISKGDKDKSSVEEKKLSDIFKVDLVKDKDGAEIKLIWEEYHKQKEVISATIPLVMYSEMQPRMQQYSSFLFPLPRAQGYEFVLCQCNGHAVHFTPLLAFQVHKENAPECLTMVHYCELRDKGIVLMRGEYDKNVLNGQEAQCLANQFQMYYNTKEKTKLKLLETFTKTPDSFKHMDLISQLENIQLV